MMKMAQKVESSSAVIPTRHAPHGGENDGGIEGDIGQCQRCQDPQRDGGDDEQKGKHQVSARFFEPAAGAWSIAPLVLRRRLASGSLR